MGHKGNMSAENSPRASRKDQFIECMKGVFAAMDKDGSGTLDKAELKKVATGIFGTLGQQEGMESVPPEQVDGMVEAVLTQLDLNGDGAVDFAELMKTAEDQNMFDFIEGASDEEFAQGTETVGKIA